MAMHRRRHVMAGIGEYCVWRVRHCSALQRQQQPTSWRGLCGCSPAAARSIPEDAAAFRAAHTAHISSAAEKIARLLDQKLLSTAEARNLNASLAEGLQEQQRHVAAVEGHISTLISNCVSTLNICDEQLASVLREQQPRVGQAAAAMDLARPGSVVARPAASPPQQGDAAKAGVAAGMAAEAWQLAW